MVSPMDTQKREQIAQLDHAHVWHPFTPMRQWREVTPLIIEQAEGDHLIDAEGNRYIDGVSSLWCNVHGHRVKEIDDAVRDQLDKVAHTTMLGLTHPVAVELAARLCELAPRELNKVFYSDAGATATEVAFKMAVGYQHHRGRTTRDTFIAIEGAYHGDTTGAMSVGYSETFHRAFESMVFHTEFVPAPSRDDAAPALATLEQRLVDQRDRVAAVVIEPLVQGAAGLVVHPDGYLRGVADLCRKHDVLLIVDEVATGFGRTGTMFACEQENVEPDLMCLGKGITGGYMPLAATLCTDEIAAAFEGELHEHRTLYHGHTYTGNPLACAAALASLDLFEQNNLLDEVNRKAALVATWLSPLEKQLVVTDIRQKGLMVGIELTPPGEQASVGFDPSRRLGYEVCAACRGKGVIIRPLGNVVVLMPPLAIRDENLKQLADAVVESISELTARLGDVHEQ